MAEPRCAFCGRPGEWPVCCEVHRKPMCDVDRAVKGSINHRDPAKATGWPRGKGKRGR